jgi:hypothetical protein
MFLKYINIQIKSLENTLNIEMKKLGLFEFFSNFVLRFMIAKFGLKNFHFEHMNTCTFT